jgi:hypothetical protein
MVDVSTTGYTGTNLFVPGDVVLITPSSGVRKLAWVGSVNSTQVWLIDNNGNSIGAYTGCDIQVIRSGLRNQPTQPIMWYTTLNNPVGVSSLNSPSQVISSGAVSASSCWNNMISAVNFDCSASSNSCGLVTSAKFNPWKNGFGPLRPDKSYAYQVDRLENTVSGTPVVDLRSGGTYASYTPFYKYSSTLGRYVPITNSNHPNYVAGSTEKWLLMNTATTFNEHGLAIENKDILGNYSSIISGYNKYLKLAPIAAANNARYTDIASDGFEDYFVRSDLGLCTSNSGHFNFNGLSSSNLVTTESHTGRYSLKVEESDVFEVNRKISTITSPNCLSWREDKGFEFDPSNALLGFSPQPGKYVLSTWVKQNLTTPSVLNSDAKIDVVIGYPTGDVTFTFSGSETAIIEGWQKIDGEFTINSGATCITVKLYHGGNNTAPLYYDDLRIHPFNASMLTMVYDPFTMRPLAQLDDRNFATFFEYDENGIAVRVKQETLTGIYTVTETRGSIRK